MKIKKLFQVLVLGGTTLVLGVAACGGSDGSNNGGQQQTLPTDAAVDYVFVRLASVIAFVLRQTGRLI